MTNVIKREDNWVNVVKLLCVLVVVLGHYNYTDWVGTKWLLYIVKSAVSVMFIYSGYYLCKNKTLDDHGKVKSYLEHLVIITIVWVFIYFVRDIYYSGFDAVKETFEITMRDVANFNSGHFWYVQNLFLAVAIMFCIQKKHFKIWEVIVLIILQKCYYWLLICSLASIGIGYILAESKKAFDKKKLLGCLCTGIMAVAVLCGISYECINVPNALSDVIIEMMRYVLSVSVAVIGLCMDELVPLKLGIVGRYIRKLGTVIYLSHNFFVEFTFKIASHYGAVWGDKWYFIYSAGAAVFLSFATGIALIALSELKPFRILKKIY